MPKYLDEAGLSRFWDNIKGSIGSASQEQVDAWLDSHPEATTTVQDGSITDAKLVQTGGVLSEVHGVRTGADGVTYDSAGDSVRTQFENAMTDIDRLNDLSYGMENLMMPVEWFEHGSLHNGANDTWRAGSRMRNKEVLRFSSDVMILCTNGHYFVTYYDASDAFSSESAWVYNKAATLIPKNQGFKLVVTLNSGAPATQVDSLTDMLGCVRLVVDGATKNVKNVMNLEFERGSLSGGADDAWQSLARARSKGIACLPVSVNVSMKTGAYAVHYFGSNGEFKEETGWVYTNKTLIPAGQKFRLVLTNTVGVNTPSTIQAIVDNLAIEPVQGANTSGAVPNIIYQCRNVDDAAVPPESKWYVQAAANNQYDRVRFTVRKTTDGYYFNCHDEVINTYARNSDGSEIGTSIPANGQTLAALNQYDWGIKYGARYAGATVPLLEETLKYAAMFNLGVTWHSASTEVETDAAIAEQLAMIDKYGLADNLIVIGVNGHDLTMMQKFVAHNPRISCYVGADWDYFSASGTASAIKTLQTQYNKIYVQLLPWGTYSTPEFIAFARANNFVIYNSVCMSKADLLSDATFSSGYGLIEANNVYAIKDTVRNWVNGMVN